MPLVYDELRRVARRQRRGPTQTLDTTALVHETYLKMAGAAGVEVSDRAHFLAVAATAMRQVLIGRARARARLKRGGGEPPLELEESRVGAPAAAAEWLLDVDRALAALQRQDERLARIFECRFFAGLSEEETAQALGISLRTSQRGWMRARAWLRAALEAGPEASAGE